MLAIDARVFNIKTRNYGRVIRADKYKFLVEYDNEERELFKYDTKQIKVVTTVQERLAI